MKTALRRLVFRLRRAPWWLLKFAALIAAIYIGGYYVIVEPAALWFVTGVGPWPRTMRCRIGGKVAEFVFTPAMLVEKRIYPRRWQYTEEDF